MIELYKIKTENANKVLYLYLNYDYEFGKDINDKIVNAMKKKIDIFNVAKIVLIIGGITVSSIYIKDNHNYLSPIKNKEVVESVVFSDYENIIEINDKEEAISKNNMELE